MGTPMKRDAFATLFVCLLSGGVAHSQQNSQTQMNDLVEQVVIKISRNLPQQLNKYTTLDGAARIDKNIILFATVSEEAAAVTVKADADAHLHRARTALCSSEGTRTTLDAGFKWTYIYRDTAGRTLFKGDVTRADCR